MKPALHHRKQTSEYFPQRRKGRKGKNDSDPGVLGAVGARKSDSKRRSTNVYAICERFELK